MTKKIQAGKNIVLSGELASFILENPDTVNKFPASATFVIFTETDIKLNKVNRELLNTLVEEGKPVVKAKKTSNEENQWVFTPIGA